MSTDQDVRPGLDLRQEWLSVQQVQAMTGLDRQTVYDALVRGELRGSQRKGRGAWRVHREDVATWLQLRDERANALTPADVAVISGYGRTMIYEALQDGDLLAHKVGGKWLISHDAVRAWMRGLQRTAPT